ELPFALSESRGEPRAREPERAPDTCPTHGDHECLPPRHARQVMRADTGPNRRPAASQSSSRPARALRFGPNIRSHWAGGPKRLTGAARRPSTLRGDVRFGAYFDRRAPRIHPSETMLEQRADVAERGSDELVRRAPDKVVLVCARSKWRAMGKPAALGEALKR